MTPAIVTDGACQSSSPAMLSLARLLQFGDSMLPVGNFAFSCGLESAVQTGVVSDVETLGQFVLTALVQTAHLDAVGLVHATQAALDGDTNALLHIDHEIYCRKRSEEARTMTTKTGRKLAELGASVACVPSLLVWRDAVLESRTHGTWPVSLAVLFAATGVSSKPSPEEALTVLFYGTAATILNAAIRLMRVTHTDIQRILYGSCAHFQLLMQTAMDTRLEDMSGFAPMTDILTDLHTRARVRLFMS